MLLLKGEGETTRILVTGDRDWRNAFVIHEALREVLRDVVPNPQEGVTLISGDARGADLMSDAIAQLLGFQVERFPALWQSEGRGAGPIRNQRMLASGVDFVVGFHNSIQNSRGTRDMLRRCARTGVPGYLFTEGGKVEDWTTLVT